MSSRFSTFCTTLAVAGLASLPSHAAPSKPNVIFILTDDLGYGDVGFLYQNARKAAGERSKPWTSTPNLDGLAASGAQIPQHYCPAPVCAPSRASFLLGVTQGHANVRDNQFDKKLEDNFTVGSVLKEAGYATACIGKWGLQGKETEAQSGNWPSAPWKRGFDTYFGYIAHGAGHAHYPKEDGKRLLDGDKTVTDDYDGCYTTDLFTAKAKKWIVDQTAAKPDQPFFLYLAYDTPHAKLQYPPGPFPAGGGLKGGLQWLGTPHKMINTADGKPDSYCHPDYENATWDNDKNPATPEKPWPEVYKRYATDVRRIDDCVGDLNQLLKDLKISDNTLVIFTSDNGPSQESYLPQNYEANFFGSTGPFDGIKRDVWEGGIRVGALATWPGHIPAGTVSKTPSGFWDWLPTFAEMAGLPAPARTDGVSLLPGLTGKGTQPASTIYTEYAFNGKTPSYPEFLPEHRGRVRGQMQALRIGNYIGVRYDVKSHADPFEIYDIVNDPQQSKNLAADPKFAPLQQQLHDEVLRLRRPDEGAPRPYDNELVPAVEVAGLKPGVEWRTVKGGFPWAAKIDDLKPTAKGTSNAIDVTALPKDNEAALFTGYIRIPKDGAYEFHISTETRALLRIHGATVVDADFGRKINGTESGTISLKAGTHPFRLYFKRRSDKAPKLDLTWNAVGETATPLKAEELSR